MGFLRKLFSLLFSSLKPVKYGKPSETLNGEIVKSNSEKKIADYLYKNNISYIYEKPIYSKGFISNKKISNPDFYLTKSKVIIEYWGMYDIPNKRKRSKYRQNMRWKMKQYHDNNIKFISIFPKGLKYLDWIIRKDFKELTGKQLY